MFTCLHRIYSVVFTVVGRVLYSVVGAICSWTPCRKRRRRKQRKHRVRLVLQNRLTSSLYTSFYPSLGNNEPKFVDYFRFNWMFRILVGTKKNKTIFFPSFFFCRFHLNIDYKSHPKGGGGAFFNFVDLYDIDTDLLISIRFFTVHFWFRKRTLSEKQLVILYNKNLSLQKPRYLSCESGLKQTRLRGVFAARRMRSPVLRSSGIAVLRKARK